MTTFEKYKAYIRDNPEGYWFKRRLFGWGWVPVRWQGFMIILVYIGAIVAFSLTIDKSSPNHEIFSTFLLPVALLTIALITVCYRKGEKPKWSWGFPEEDKNE